MARIELDGSGCGSVDLDGDRVHVVATTLETGRRTAFEIVAERSRQLQAPVAVRTVTPDGFIDVVVDAGGLIRRGPGTGAASLSIVATIAVSALLAGLAVWLLVHGSPGSALR